MSLSEHTERKAVLSAIETLLKEPISRDLRALLRKMYLDLSERRAA